MTTKAISGMAGSAARLSRAAAAAFIAIAPIMLGGCPVFQQQDTPVEPAFVTEGKTRAKYWLYVPSDYSPQRPWPLVITLHGTFGWDGAERQMDEWKHLAEEKGVIVAAPELSSTQGILPVVRSLWIDDLRKDERTILAVLDDVSRNYHVEPNTILLSGFSAGGYPLFYAGLRNPDRFGMLIARACNCEDDVFDGVRFDERTRRLPVVIFWGRDDMSRIRDQSWLAFRRLRENGCKLTRRDEVEGGHLRRPELAYKYWAEILPPELRR